MLDTDDYLQDIYESTLRTLEERLNSKEADWRTFEREFEALTVYQGHGWDGRNAFKEAEIEGQVQAYQVFFHRNHPKNATE